MECFYNKDGSMNWNAIGTTVLVIGGAVVAGQILVGQLAKTDLGKKLLAVS